MFKSNQNVLALLAFTVDAQEEGASKGLALSFKATFAHNGTMVNFSGPPNLGTQHGPSL